MRFRLSSILEFFLLKLTSISVSAYIFETISSTEQMHNALKSFLERLFVNLHFHKMLLATIKLRAVDRSTIEF